MNWKEQQKEQVQSIRTGMPSVSVLRIAIKAMLDHWPDEVEQRPDPLCTGDVNECRQIYQTQVTRAENAEKERDDLRAKNNARLKSALEADRERDEALELYRALARGNDILREATERAKEHLGADGYENVDHAAERVVKDRDDLKIQLDGIHMRLSDVGFVKDEETIASSVWDLVDAWESACKERDRLQAKQRDDAKSMAYMANTIQAAHEALGTAVGDDLVMACQRFRKGRDDLQAALAEQMDENGRLAGRVKAFEREKEARRRHDRMCQLGPGGW